MRVLQIGLGRWGRNHLKNWQRLGVDLRVCDVDAAALSELSVPTCSDYRSALDDVDAVDVVTPADTHESIVRTALERGKDVFLEKPVTPDPASSFALADLAAREGRILQVGHIFRFAPAALATRAAVRDGRIGEPGYLSAHFCGFKRPRSDGGAAISDGIHWVDLVSWVLGRAPRAVRATLRDVLGRGMDDVALLDLDFGDAVAHVEAGYFPPEQRRDLVVMGRDGAIACDFLAKDAAVRHFPHVHRPPVDGGAWTAEAGDPSELPTQAGEPLLDELRAFAEACESRTPSPIAADGYAGARAVAVIAAAEESAREGRSVPVELPGAPQEESR